MLIIRLSRIGKRNKPIYRLIISEKSQDPYGRSLEILGSYNPHSKELQAKAERINYWLGKGAGMSPTVNNLLIEKDIIKGEKIKASKAGKKGEAAPVAARAPKEAKPAETEAKKEEKPAEPKVETEAKPELEVKEEKMEEKSAKPEAKPEAEAKEEKKEEKSDEPKKTE